MLYYGLGDALATQDEVMEKTFSGELPAFFAALGTGRAKKIVFPSGALDVSNFVRGPVVAAGEPAPEWQPIGLGKPLTIMIREVYTGAYPKGNIFGRTKDMLVTSAVKGFAAFDAKSRAINFLKPKVAAKSRLHRPAASAQGTPVLFYSPALVERSLTLDLLMVFDEFPSEAFTSVGSAFTAAASVPVFLAASVYLIAAGQLAKLAGQAGEALFDGVPAFNSSEGIDIWLPGSRPAPVGFRLITAGDADAIEPDFQRKNHIDAEGKLVGDDGQEYSGNVPYIIISLDGTADDQLRDFAPTATSAAVLSRFLGIKDSQSQTLEPLLDGIKLYNDLTCRKQVDRLDQELAKLKPGAEKDQLKAKRDSLAKNILEDLLKPAE